MSPPSTYLAANSISYLYHFTDTANLISIFNSGALLSHKRVKERGLWVRPGGDSYSLQRAKDLGLDDYISLSYTPYTPMGYYRKKDKNLCFFVFKYTVVDSPGMVFCNTNANASNVSKSAGVEGLMSTDFQTIRSGVNPGSPKWLRAAQAEALVPETINFQHLAYISFVNELSVQQAREMNGGRHNLNFTVKPILFVDDPNVNSVPSYSILHSANFPNCKENDDELIFDRTIEENLFVVLTISTRGSYNLMLSVREVGHKASYKGSYSGQISIRFKISSLTLRNGINTLDVDLNGSFWRRKIVVVEC